MNLLWPLVALGIGGLATSPLVTIAAIKWSKWQFDRNKLEEQAQIVFERERIRNRNLAIQHIAPDANGRGGWVMLADGKLISLDTRAVFDEWAIHRIDPLAERLDRMERLLLAARGHGAASEMLEMPDLSFQWPTHYDYDTMAKRHLKRPSYHNVLLGVTYDEAGNETPVIGDMEEMIHLMIGGRSGFGKSNLEFSIGKQLNESVDPCKLALIDYAGTTLMPLARSDNVLWPVATNDAGATGIFRELVKELERRKGLFTDCPGVQKLSQYNALDDREQLEPWYVFVDETPQLVRNGDLCGMFTQIAEQARKFGIGIVAAGTTWHAKVVPEPLRINFATRTAVYCSRTTSRVVLDGEPDASDLERPGLACLMFPGKKGIQQMLTPEIEFEVVDGNGPIWALPDEPEDDGPPFSDDAIMDAWDRLPEQGHKQNKSELCKALGGQPVGGFFYKVDSAARRLGIW